MSTQISKDTRHWQYEDHKQRMTTAQWRNILLENDETVIFHGRVRHLVAKSLGAGVVEVSKKSLIEEATSGD